jgi:hypothetical protein
LVVVATRVLLSVTSAQPRSTWHAPRPRVTSSVKRCSSCSPSPHRFAVFRPSSPAVAIGAGPIGPLPRAQLLEALGMMELSGAGLPVPTIFVMSFGTALQARRRFLTFFSLFSHQLVLIYPRCFSNRHRRLVHTLLPTLATYNRQSRFPEAQHSLPEDDFFDANPLIELISTTILKA